MAAIGKKVLLPLPGGPATTIMTGRTGFDAATAGSAGFDARQRRRTQCREAARAKRGARRRLLPAEGRFLGGTRIHAGGAEKQRTEPRQRGRAGRRRAE